MIAPNYTIEFQHTDGSKLSFQPCWLDGLLIWQVPQEFRRAMLDNPDPSKPPVETFIEVLNRKLCDECSERLIGLIASVELADISKWTENGSY